MTWLRKPPSKQAPSESKENDQMKYRYPHKDGGVFEANMPIGGHQRCAEWYCFGKSTEIGQYVLDNYKVSIVCEGEMNWEMPDGTVLRGADDIPANVRSDDQLMDLFAQATVIHSSCWIVCKEVEDSGFYFELEWPSMDVDEAISTARMLITGHQMNME